jgi:CRISPR system Cascade subunit CasE
MYLSRLILNPRNRAVQRELANPYELHRTLMRGYPDDLPEDERVLFRIETDPQSGIPTVLAQSQTAPDWSDLTTWDDYLLPEVQWPPSVFNNPATKQFDLPLQTGQMLAFRLRANPTVKREGSRHGLYDEEDQRAWLDRKGRRGGFDVRRLTVIKEGNAYAWIKRNGKTRKLTHFAVRFDGILEVTEPDVLRETVKTGIGPAKGFGFGLLSLAPAR